MSALAGFFGVLWIVALAGYLLAPLGSSAEAAWRDATWCTGGLAAFMLIGSIFVAVFS